jgi:hypothetical protein
LAVLANRIPGEVDQVSHDILPKDRIGDLKQIQKLAKRPRRRVSRLGNVVRRELQKIAKYGDVLFLSRRPMSGEERRRPQTGAPAAGE